MCAVARLYILPDNDQIIIHNSHADHRIAANTQRVILAAARCGGSNGT